MLASDRLGNISPITYINFDMDTIKSASISMLKAGIPVFLKSSDSGSGIMDLDLYGFTLGFNIPLGMNQRLHDR